MRSVEQWSDEFEMANQTIEEFIEAIQRDALEAAAEVCRENLWMDDGDHDEGCRDCAQAIRALMPPTTSAYGTQDSQDKK